MSPSYYPTTTERYLLSARFDGRRVRIDPSKDPNGRITSTLVEAVVTAIEGVGDDEPLVMGLLEEEADLASSLVHGISLPVKEIYVPKPYWREADSARLLRGEQLIKDYFCLFWEEHLITLAESESWYCDVLDRVLLPMRRR